MPETIIGINAKLTKAGAKDIDLLVYSYYIGLPSPCVVITDLSSRCLVGGAIDSPEQIFDLEVAKHPGYVVKSRVNIVAITGMETGRSEPTQPVTDQAKKLQEKSLDELIALRLSLLKKMRSNPGHSGAERVELEDVSAWIELRIRERDRRQFLSSLGFASKQ